MLWQRLLFGAVMIAACVGLVALDASLSRQIAPDLFPQLPLNPAEALYQGGPIALAVGVLVVLAALELGRLAQRAGHRPITSWAAATAAVVALSPWCAPGLYRGDPWQLACLAMLACVAGAFLITIATGRIAGAIGSVSTTVMITAYVGLLASFVVRIRTQAPAHTGPWLVLYFIAVVKVTDIAAYFAGSAFGRHKLAPRLSPGKTLEGLAAGLVAAAGLSVAMASVAAIIMPSRSYSVWPGPAKALIFGVVMALAGQAGDLVESLLKRDAAQKDSGEAIPGFGGVLDVVDSPLLAAPLAWWMLG
jgi:phosphatidate cytidylyltransferase